MIRILVTGLVVQSLLLIDVPPAEPSDWSLAIRGAFGWPTAGDDLSVRASSVTALASRPLENHIGLVTSVGYLDQPAHPRFLAVCPAAPSPIGTCGTQVRNSVLIPVGIGLRLGGERTNGVLEPWFEVGPNLLYGHWVGVGGQTSNALFSGFHFSLGVPLRLSRRWSFQTGISYLHTEDVQGASVVAGGIQGLRVFETFGGFAYRLGDPPARH